VHVRLVWANTTRYWPGLYDSTSARSDRHWPGPARLNIGLGLLNSKSPSARAQTLDNDSGPIDSTSVWACSARHRPRPKRLDISSGLLGSTSTLAWSFGYRPGSARLHIEPERLSLTWAWIGSSRHWPGPTWLDIGPGQLGSTQYRPLSSTWPRVD